MASDARGVFKAVDVVATFHAGAATCGFPAQLLTDNGAVFTAVPRKGRCAIEAETARLGVSARSTRAHIHPQTCGKVERFHQTLKKWLAKQPGATSVAELHIQLDWFAAYYNTVRPHRAIGRRTPAEAFSGRPKAVPSGPRLAVPPHYRVRRDKVDITGVDHAPPQLAAAPHRPGTRAHRHAGARPRRWPPRAGPDGGRRGAPRPYSSVRRGTTSPTDDPEVEGCRETCRHDVARHHTVGGGDSNLRRLRRRLYRPLPWPLGHPPGNPVEDSNRPTP